MTGDLLAAVKDCLLIWDTRDRMIIPHPHQLPHIMETVCHRRIPGDPVEVVLTILIHLMEELEDLLLLIIIILHHSISNTVPLLLEIETLIPTGMDPLAQLLQGPMIAHSLCLLTVGVPLRTVVLQLLHGLVLK